MQDLFPLLPQIKFISFIRWTGPFGTSEYETFPLGWEDGKEISFVKTHANKYVEMSPLARKIYIDWINDNVNFQLQKSYTNNISTFGCYVNVEGKVVEDDSIIICIDLH
jgi:hypothetical protein